jgi:hypothetical protein
MSRPTLTIHNADTGEVIERELTDAELLQHEADLSAAATRKADQIAKESAKAAVLARLGITSEEAQLILGGSN